MGAVSYAVLGISLVHVAVQAVAIGVHWGYYVRQAGVDGCDGRVRRAVLPHAIALMLSLVIATAVPSGLMLLVP